MKERFNIRKRAIDVLRPIRRHPVLTAASLLALTYCHPYVFAIFRSPEENQSQTPLVDEIPNMPSATIEFTKTPMPTPTLAPTSTPTRVPPTETPRPTPTNTPEPTPTPIPTPTPTPTPKPTEVLIRPPAKQLKPGDKQTITLRFNNTLASTIDASISVNLNQRDEQLKKRDPDFKEGDKSQLQISVLDPQTQIVSEGSHFDLKLGESSVEIEIFPRAGAKPNVCYEANSASLIGDNNRSLATSSIPYFCIEESLKLTVDTEIIVDKPPQNQLKVILKNIANIPQDVRLKTSGECSGEKLAQQEFQEVNTHVILDPNSDITIPANGEKSVTVTSLFDIREKATECEPVFERKLK